MNFEIYHGGIKSLTVRVRTKLIEKTAMFNWCHKDKPIKIFCKDEPNTIDDVNDAPCRLIPDNFQSKKNIF